MLDFLFNPFVFNYELIAKKVPFIQWTYTGGNISNMTPLSSRMVSASDNLRQSLPIFLAFALLSIILNVDNLMLAQAWFA